MKSPLFTSILIILGCGAGSAGPTISSFAVTFSTELDEGLPLANVVVAANGSNLGASDQDGLVQTMLRGPAGAEVQISYECPEGYNQPEGAQTLRLHRFQSLDPEVQTGLHMRLGCTPLLRTAAFVVRTGQANLPILLDGEVVAETNAMGMAHIVRQVSPDTEFRLKIDTSSKAGLQPEDPGMQFVIGAHDEVFTWDQAFEEPPPVRRRRRRRRPRPLVITRIN